MLKPHVKLARRIGRLNARQFETGLADMPKTAIARIEREVSKWEANPDYNPAGLFAACLAAAAQRDKARARRRSAAAAA